MKTPKSCRIPQWALDTKQGDTPTVTAVDILPYLKNAVTCPSGGKTFAAQQAQAGKECPRQQSLVFVNQFDLVASCGHLERLEGIVGAPDLHRMAIQIGPPRLVMRLRHHYQAGGGRLCVDGDALVGEAGLEVLCPRLLSRGDAPECFDPQEDDLAQIEVGLRKRASRAGPVIGKDRLPPSGDERHGIGARPTRTFCPLRLFTVALVALGVTKYPASGITSGRAHWIQTSSFHLARQVGFH